MQLAMKKTSYWVMKRRVVSRSKELMCMREKKDKDYDKDIEGKESHTMIK